MSVADEDRQESEVPGLAVLALQDAQHRAVRAGHPQVLIRGVQLVRVEAGQTTVLKQLTGRRKVSVRVKRRTP